MQGLDYADRHDLLPVVDMERYRSRYNEDDDRSLGTKNAWEYYFAQPSGLTVTEALSLNPLDNQGVEEGGLIYVGAIEPPPCVLHRIRELRSRYIRVRPEILAEVKSLLGSDFRPDVLGVHVRGTDMSRGNIPGHPVPLPALAYFEQAAALDRTHSFSRIFLACDELETVSLFKKYFTDRLLVIEAHRTSVDAVVTNDYRWLFEPRRELHRYRLGREVLMDALLLARCGHLLCGISNVTHAAMYFSDGCQTVHPVPPLWCHPPPNEASRGRAFVSACPTLETPLSADALATQSEILQKLLENSENMNARTAQRVESLQKQMEALREQVAFLSRRASDKSDEAKAAHREMNSLKKNLARANSKIRRLKKRIAHLVNWWTWMGWRLMPWTKPGWRRNPLED